MEDTAYRAIAIVGVGSILPDATDTEAFWENVRTGRYSISEVAPERWDPALYYDPDHSAPDKTYSKIGGWVRESPWDPMKWRLPIPPRVADGMDGGQKWAIACTRAALEDYGYPRRPLDTDRTAVILGNAMAGEKHYLTVLRIQFPEYARELAETSSFAALPAPVRQSITRELHERMAHLLPEITEDTMPGELSNCIAGRIANLYNFHGPNYVVDAACASAMAAISSSVDALIERDFDAAITGGIDRNMGVSSFVKFCKIGALSATGTRPYAEGADGFVMGEGAVVFILKRLADAERNGDKIYAVLRGMAGASDGKGKGITAPNPAGQKICIQRAWENAGLSPATVTLMEGHGTSTSVGDVVEVQSMNDVLASYHMPPHSVALGSVKSNIGHLKGASGAAGLLKTALALRDRVLPPSVNCEHPNPNIDFAHSPLYVNTELRPWTVPAGGVRRAGVSAFGFGGTNFHAVLEEYIPHRLTSNGKSVGYAQDSSPSWGGPPGPRPTPPSAASDLPQSHELGQKRDEGVPRGPGGPPHASKAKAPLRGALVIGAPTEAALSERLRSVHRTALTGDAPPPSAPAEADLRAPERLAIDYADAADLADKSGKALKALAANQPAVWKALRPQGIFRGQGPAGKVAFLYPGQGSQYVNMLRPFCDAEPIVAGMFAEADRVMTPILGKPLSQFIFVDQNDPEAVERAENDLRQTAITQPAVLASDQALTLLLSAYGIHPDMTMGHSLGEYGALVAAGALPFADALVAVAARGREMTRVSMADNGKMAAVFAPVGEIERILKTIDGYVVIANINSSCQAVIGGSSKAVEQASEIFVKAGYDAVPLSVSHAFHTSVVAPASEPLRRVLERLRLEAPHVPTVANVNGKFYPTGDNVVPQMLDLLSQQVAAPVQFVQGLQTLYAAGARIFVEVGPKKALQGFAEDVLGSHGDVISMFTNHPKVGDIVAFNQALCALYAAGCGTGVPASVGQDGILRPVANRPDSPAAVPPLDPQASLPVPLEAGPPVPLETLGQMFAGVLERGWELYHPRNGAPNGLPVAITGAALGLPGTDRIFDDSNVARILRGDQFIDVIPTRFRKAMLDKHITRLVKSDTGDPVFESIGNVSEVIKLAARGGAFDLASEFGIPADRVASLDRGACLAIAAGIDALRDAGIPLVMRYKSTSIGGRLPDRWGLPDGLRDETGVIFASAYPGFNGMAEEMARYHADRSRREQLAMLEDLRPRVASNGHSTLGPELDRRIQELRAAIEKEPYTVDRRFLFRTLSMGHSQFADLIGARGPNTQINAACASSEQAISLAEDWIHTGRCRRVVVVSADDITSDYLMEWFGAGFLASGAAATDEAVEDAAIPFDRRRHGMVLGMGAAAFVVEDAAAARERGLRPICEVLGSVTANSAFHGSRLDIQHIGQMMEKVVAQAEARGGIPRAQLAAQMVFVSHETYTPARGGSASAEIHALRQVFGDSADQIVIANTKGLTGHAMGTGIEEVVAIKALETGCVPPVANFKEVDPELGPLNLSKGGIYPVEYALRLGAGFGSQVALTLLRRVKTNDTVRPGPQALGYRYRIVDEAAWDAWLLRMAGHPAAELEVVQRTLRVRDLGLAAPNGKSAREVRPAAAPAPIAKQAVVVPAAPAAPPPPAPAAVVQPELRKPTVPTVDPVKERILALVVEKTGYPQDMLDMELDLEADLGVDTVKQAELFAAIRQVYDIPRADNLKLRDFPTLAHIVRFVYDKRPDLESAPPAPVQPAIAVAGPPIPNVSTPAGSPPVPNVSTPAYYPPVPNVSTPHGASTPPDYPQKPAVPTPAGFPPKPAVSTPPGADLILEKVLDIVADKTGYPKEMLDLDLDLEADLGIDTVKQAEMFAAIRQAYDIPRDQNLRLRDFPTLAHVIQFARDRAPAAPAAPPAAPVATAPSPVEAAPTTTSQAEDPILEKVLEIVADKTGYPKDMLDLDLDLEADLGVDTVKQAEMFAAIRQTYNIPRDQNLKLRDFPTLAHVIQFARERSAAGEPAPAPAQSPAEAAPARPVLATLDAANGIPRRVPVPVLRPALDLCKPTGVKLVAGSRVVIMPDHGGVAEALSRQLEALGVEVAHPEALPGSPIAGVYWLSALDDEGDLRKIDLATWKEALRVRVKSLYTTMRALYDQTPFLVSATSLGGQHGYGAIGASAPMGGAVVGFTKTYKQERRDILVKAVDFEPRRDPAQIARTLIEETLRDPGAVEIGYQSGERWTVSLAEQPAADGQPGMKLGPDTVFVVTGAAGSIVSAITADLAAASGGTFYLLDLVPEPDPGNPDLARFVNDKEGLKRDLFARIQARGDRATPALVERELAALERSQAASSAIDAVRAAGGAAHYLSVNLTDADGVAKAIDQVRSESGRIDVLLHAAGIERSHFLPDKDPREFDLVFDVKSDGWFHLLRAIGDMPLGATVAFSSIAGRFGNGGQTDYSSANDLLCKFTSSFRTTRPQTRGIVIDWTAWGGIGMATRGSIPKMMELAGIDMLPPEAGIPLIRRELTAGATRGEIVVGRRLGILLNEWDATGGLDTAAPLPASGPMAGRIAGMSVHGGLTIETTLDPRIQPFLHDHRIDGTPVLPGVMGIEAFAEAARSVLPGWHVAAVEEVNFLAPVKFYRNEPRTLTVRAVFYPDGEGLVADCQLTGSRPLPNQAEPQFTTHFTARVRLARQAATADAAPALVVPTGASFEAADIYRVYFHGPAYQVLERAWLEGDRVVGQMAQGLTANHHPGELSTLMAPRLVELCEQTAGLWEIVQQSRMGLPLHIDRVRRWRDPEGVAGPLFAVVTPHPDGSFDADVVDAGGARYVQVEGYRTVALPGGVNPELLKAMEPVLA